MGGDESLLAACGQVLAGPGEVAFDHLAVAPVRRSDLKGLLEIGDGAGEVADARGFCYPNRFSIKIWFFLARNASA